MDENKEVNSTVPKREKVRVIPLSAIDDAPDHPFQVRDDEEMAELVESISTFGAINPVIVRKGERYELISGHRRKYACAKLGIDTLSVIVRDLSREEAIIFMVDSNLQREHILPSERAKAYTYPFLAKNMGWEYDASKISIPYFMTAGTGSSDDSGVEDIYQKFGGVCPLEALKDIYNTMSQDTTKIRARIKGAEHEDMLTLTDGYMTAWFLYHLQGDEEAGTVFFGDNAEILNNPNWQDVEKNI